MRLGGARQVGTQSRHLRFEIDAGTAQPRQGGSGALHVAVTGEPARRLRQEQHAHCQHHARHRAEPQHPAPGPVRGERVAHEVGHQDPRRDGKLAQRDQGAALASGGDLGEVQRRQHRCAADAGAPRGGDPPTASAGTSRRRRRARRRRRRRRSRSGSGAGHDGPDSEPAAPAPSAAPASAKLVTTPSIVSER